MPKLVIINFIFLQFIIYQFIILKVNSKHNNHHHSLEYLNNQIYNQLLSVESNQLNLITNSQHKILSHKLIDLSSNQLSINSNRSKIHFLNFNHLDNKFNTTNQLDKTIGDDKINSELLDKTNLNRSNITNQLDKQANYEIKKQENNFKYLNKNLFNVSLKNNQRKIRSSNNQKLTELVRRTPCETNKDCHFSNSCDPQSKLCKCPKNYINVRDLDGVKDVEPVNWPPTHCYAAQQLEKSCIYDEQCVVKHSKCTRDENLNLGQQLHCACSLGYTSKEQEELLKFGSFQMKLNKICTATQPQARLSFIVIIVMCAIILTFGIIICILMLFRLRKRKQRPFTMTTLVGQNPNLTMTGGQMQNQAAGGYLTQPMATGSPIMNQQGNMMLPNQHINALSGQPNHHHMMMQQQHPSFRMAPIGSSAAEFENDFIGVFPHHHLEAMPDL